MALPSPPVFSAMDPVEPDFSLLQGIPEDYTTKEKWSVEEYIAFVCDKLRKVDPNEFPDLVCIIDEETEPRRYSFELPHYVVLNPNIAGSEHHRPVAYQGFPITLKNYHIYCDQMGVELPQVVTWADPQDNGDYPQTNISAYDACRYANWLSEKLGFKPAYDTQSRESEECVVSVHTAPAVMIPAAAHYRVALGNIPNMSEAELGEICIHRDNSGNQMHKVRQPGTNHVAKGMTELPAYWSDDHYLGVISPSGNWYPAANIPAGVNMGIFGVVGNVYMIVAVYPNEQK